LWKKILHEFSHHQHKRANETEATLIKKYKNLSGTKSKLHKPFPSKPNPERKKGISDEAYTTLLGKFQEEQAFRAGIFNKCKGLDC
jgi:hypothetical protein